MKRGEWQPVMCCKTFKKGIYSIFPLLLKQPTLLIRFFFCICFLAYAISGVDLNKANHLHIAECFTSCHCSITLLSFPWWCLSASEVSICLCLSPGNLAVDRTVKLLEKVMNDTIKVRIDRRLYQKFEIWKERCCLFSAKQQRWVRTRNKKGLGTSEISGLSYPESGLSRCTGVVWVEIVPQC